MRRALIALALVAGCSSSGSKLGSGDIELTITTDLSVQAVLPSIKSLELTAHGAKVDHTTMTLGRAMNKVERMLVHVSSVGGTIQIGVVAKDGNGNLVGLGFGTTILNSSGPSTMTVRLAPPLGLDGGSDGSPFIVALTPAQWTLFPGQTLLFTSNDRDAVFSVSEGDAGGTIDASGKYTAPSTPGTYHVVASSAIYFGQSASATVTVQQNGEVVVLGRLGGQGYQDGSGANARVGSILGMASDGSAVYATGYDLTLRKLDLASGALSTIAGTLNTGPAADGTGAAARFILPEGIALDGKGNAYVGDRSTLRKIVLATGQVTTFAGLLDNSGNVDGVGSSARMGGIISVAYDGVNTLYLLDGAYCNIRRVDIPSQTVSVIAGFPAGGTPPGCSGDTDGTGTAARFGSVSRFALDGNNLWIGEYGGPLRKMAVGSNVVSTAPGPAINPNAMAYDGHGGVWFSSNGLVRVDVATGARDPATFPRIDNGASPANWFTIAPDGTFYFLSSGSAFYRWTPGGTATLLAGAEPATSGTMAPNPQGIPLTTASIYPLTETVAPDGTIYVLNYNEVYKIDQAAGVISALFTITPNGPVNAVPDPNGFLVVAVGSAIMRFDAGGGATLVAGAAGMGGMVDAKGAAARFASNLKLAADAAGNLYVGDWFNCAVRKVATDGTVTTFAGAIPPSCGNMPGTGTAARIGSVSAIAYDGLGALYVGDATSNKIWQISVPGGVVTSFTGSGTIGHADGAPTVAQFNGIDSLVVDAARQNLYVADRLNNTIRKVSLATGNVSTVAGTWGLALDAIGPAPSTLNQPSSIGRLPNGDLVVLSQPEQSLLQLRLP